MKTWKKSAPLSCCMTTLIFTAMSSSLFSMRLRDSAISRTINNHIDDDDASIACIHDYYYVYYLLKDHHACALITCA